MTATAPPFELDVLDPTLFVRGVAHDVFDWLRANDPVHRDERNGIWVLTKYDDIVYNERRPEVFSSAQGVRPKGGGSGDLSLISVDDPEHARLRKLVARGFTPSRINELTGHIRELARELIDAVAAQGECDVVEDLAKPLPLIVIAELMGLPVEDRRQLGEWSDAMMGGEGAEGDDPRLQRAGTAWAEYVTYLSDVIDDRRRNPRDDLLSVLLSSADAGELAFDEAALMAKREAGGVAAYDALVGDEVLTFCVLLLVAGNETTRNAISGGLAVLSEFPEQRDRLVADLSLVPSATEEMLRMVSPVLSFSRTVTRDTELRGRQLREGDVILNCYPAANRDPEVFDDPHTFRVDRQPNLHLAFGTGPHFCLGANLARTEMRIMFEELFTRLPDFRVPDGAGPRRGESTLVGTIEHLPAVFTPR